MKKFSYQLGKEFKSEDSTDDINFIFNSFHSTNEIILNDVECEIFELSREFSRTLDIITMTFLYNDNTFRELIIRNTIVISDKHTLE